MRILQNIEIYSYGPCLYPLPGMEIRSVHAVFERCPQCEGEMREEHAHYRCTVCGWRDSCCD